MQIAPNAATTSSEVPKLHLVCVIPMCNELLLFSETLWACPLKFFRVTFAFLGSTLDSLLILVPDLHLRLVLHLQDLSVKQLPDCSGGASLPFSHGFFHPWEK